jgi:DNA (cytosine-5)-methyltransferase 1
MIREQFSLDINHELIIDNFAGGGGASCGIELGLGRHVDVAINHDPEAVAMHEANHPQTKHYCESVWDVNPLEVAQGRPVGLAWFSPDCKHFSKAKGGKPVEKKIRGLAWIVLRWAALVRPRVIILENVEEFKTWGPLTDDGRPCPNRKGQTFRSFVRQLQEKGYAVETRELRACDYGAPTIRKRLFMIARCDGQPIVWPTPTHAAPDSEAVKQKLLKPWRTAAECIDWSLPCPSIFERTKPLAENTLKRIARGLKRYVLESGDPFIVTLSHGEGKPGAVQRWGTGARNIDEPFQTVTANSAYAVVVPTLIQTGYGERPGQAPRVPGLDKTLGTVVAGGAKHALVSAFLAKHFGGNYTGPGADLHEPTHTVTATDHHALVTAHIKRDFGASVGHSIDEPTGTVTAGGGGKTALVTSNLIKLRGTSSAAATNEPLHTVSAGGLHHAEVRAFLIKYYSEGGQDQDCRDPMHTVPTKDRLGLVTVAGQEYQIADIGMRMLEPHELYAAQGFPSDYIIAPTVAGKRLPKHAQVRMCGNSVCPPLAKAIVAANVPELAAWNQKEIKSGAVAA